MINTLNNNKPIDTNLLKGNNSLYIKRQVGIQNIEANKTAQKHEDEVHKHDGNNKRQTYGLVILELMSDEEYMAWERATASMSDGEKLLAIQKLYPLADIDKLKEKIQINETKDSNNAQKENDVNMIYGIKAYNVSDNFLQRFKNIYSSMHSSVDING